MAQWEYFTTVLEANVDIAPVPVRDEVPMMAHPKYSIYTLIPQLNNLGAKGWELVRIEPVVVGKNGDLVPPNDDSAKWARQFFCAFKRELP